MFTSIALDINEIEARREALRWLADQITWERRFRFLGQPVHTEEHAAAA